LAGLTSLKLGSIGAQLGETINEFSSDGTMSGNSNTAVPTEQAVRTYTNVTVKADQDNTSLTPSFAATNQAYNTNGYVTTYRDSIHELTNVVYNANFLPTSWTEKTAGGVISYAYTVTYDVNNRVSTITRV
jgi:hypothetical protein